MMQGDNWIADQVGAIMNGPDWDSTADLHHLGRLRLLLRPRPAPADLGSGSPS